MSLFSPTIGTFWLTPFLDGEVISRDGDLTVVANANLDSDKRVMVLRTVDRKVYAVLTPAIANKLGLYGQQALTEPLLRKKCTRAMSSYMARTMFSISRRRISMPCCTINCRPACVTLNLADEAVFASFQSSASEQDLDNVYVELDHWAVFGAFEHECLVCAASMYSWGGQKVADVGVLTLPPYRGMGHASRVVRAISRYAYEQGYEPQYRCQIDNVASVSLARSAGLGLFGTWEVVSPDCVE
jgi:GNAT superfamily N-acetyltransferase